MIAITYGSHASAMLALMDRRWTSGICAACGKRALLCVKEAAPFGDYERYYIGTSCCGVDLSEEGD